MTLMARSQSAVRAAPRAADPIRLLKFVTFFGVGGTEGQVVTLAKEIDESRFDLRLACLRCQGVWLERLGALADRPLTEYHITNLFNADAFMKRARFARHLRRERIDIVHTYSFYPNVFAIPAARLAGTPVIIASIRDMGAYVTPLQRRAQRVICRLAHRVVVNAEAVRRWLIDDGYDAGRITVIPNGLDLSRFVPRGHPSALRQEFGLPPRAPLVAIVCRLTPSKGLEYFLQAAALVAERRDDARFLIVGDAAPHERDYRTAIESYAAKLGLSTRVVFTGMRMDVPEILSDVSVSVQTSLTEGLSNVVLESMACGVPVVATPVGGTAEAVEDGVSGLLVPARDPAALAVAIRRILDDRELAVRVGAVGRRWVAERFSVNVAVERTEHLYEELLEARRRGRRA